MRPAFLLLELSLASAGICLALLVSAQLCCRARTFVRPNEPLFAQVQRQQEGECCYWQMPRAFYGKVFYATKNGQPLRIHAD